MEGDYEERQKRWDNQRDNASPNKKLQTEATVWVCKECGKESHVSCLKCAWCYSPR